MRHRFENGKTQKGNAQQTFIIEVEVLDLSAIQTFPQYLIDHVHLLFEGDNAAKVDTYWPITVEVNGTLRICEEIMWSLVSDTLPDAKSWVVQYINVLCKLASQTEYGDLIYNDGCNFIGSFALKPFLDRYFEQDESRSNAALPVYESFINFIRHCDLEFETWQDEYIEKVLNKLIFVDEKYFVALFCLRLCEGQLTDKDFRYIYHFLGRFSQSKSYLKKVIDYLTDESNEIVEDCREEKSIYLTLCAAIYGSHEKETKDVMDYVYGKVGNKLSPLCSYTESCIKRIRSECDAYRAFQPATKNLLDSSFHVYDQQNKVWLPLDAKTE